MHLDDFKSSKSESLIAYIRFVDLLWRSTLIWDLSHCALIVEISVQKDGLRSEQLERHTVSSVIQEALHKGLAKVAWSEMSKQNYCRVVLTFINKVF